MRRWLNRSWAALRRAFVASSAILGWGAGEILQSRYKIPLAHLGASLRQTTVAEEEAAGGGGGPGGGGGGCPAQGLGSQSDLERGDEAKRIGGGC